MQRSHRDLPIRYADFSALYGHLRPYDSPYDSPYGHLRPDSMHLSDPCYPSRPRVMCCDCAVTVL